MPEQAPFTDPVAPILSASPDIDDAKRADLYDLFHNAKDAGELARHLQSVAVPDSLKQQLFDTKKKYTPAVEPIDKATAAINRIGGIDSKVLELAEKYPTVTKALIAVAAKEEKVPGEGSDGSAASSKGKTRDAEKKPAPLVQPPRPDGLEHLPPIPDGHHRILASNGSIHDIPAENIEKARAIDPRMHVLNP